MNIFIIFIFTSPHFQSPDHNVIQVFYIQFFSKVKNQMVDCWSRMLLGEPESSLNDLIFMRELKMGSYAYDRGRAAHTLPPQVSNLISKVFEYLMRHSFHVPLFRLSSRM